MPKFHVPGGGIIEIDSWDNVFISTVNIPTARNPQAPTVKHDRPPGKEFDHIGDQDYIQGSMHVFKRYWAKRGHYTRS